MANTISVAKTANDLVFKCSAVARDGADFPTVWDAVLKGHALVVGPSIQTLDDENRPQLEIRLINGQCLIYNSVSNEYGVSWVPRRRPFWPAFRASAPLPCCHADKDRVAVPAFHSDAIAGLVNACADLGDLLEYGRHVGGENLSHGLAGAIGIDHLKAIAVGA